jgi:hypothetical protein
VFWLVNLYSLLVYASTGVASTLDQKKPTENISLAGDQLSEVTAINNYPLACCTSGFRRITHGCNTTHITCNTQWLQMCSQYTTICDILTGSTVIIGICFHSSQPIFVHAITSRVLQYSHESLNDGDTFWEMRRQVISSLCERHRVLCVFFWVIPRRLNHPEENIQHTEHGESLKPRSVLTQN